MSNVAHRGQVQYWLSVGHRGLVIVIYGCITSPQRAN